ncbi:PREDICTED: uncharacterized protein LOC109149335 [Ipomoea nil]|uniref:uncharacterized protein LOC109149335 n=1 Tax=Ipomoea nil TaxID=35883 RepID=UPI00090110B7|nr:PREDICTED: uncharacterized protein LOC109149335 [Ipomoea nil]
MDVELGLKLTRPADEFSSANFQLLKDHRSPLFQSKETITMFILTAHLRGYKRGDIKIEINEDGSVMVIGGEKAVEETVMMGWRLYKKGTETLKLKKSFRIPNGVVLDKIEAMFNEDESVLTVSMPKTVTGIMVGSVVEEIIEEIPRQESAEIPQSPRKPERKLQGSEEEHGQDSWEDDKLIILDEDSPEDDQETSLQTGDEGESSGAKQEEVADEEELPRSDEGDVHQEDEDHRRREEEEEEEGGEKCSSILCAPIVAGSALLLSFVVFAIQCIRRTNRPTPQNNVE